MKIRTDLVWLINYCIDLSLNVIISFLSLIVPKNKDLILSGSLHGTGFNGNPRYFYLYLLGQKSTQEVYWITRNKELFKRLNSKNLPVIYLYSWKGFFSILTAYFLIIEIGPRDVSYVGCLVGNFNIVQTWHGTPIKKIGFDYYNNFDGIKTKLCYKLPMALQKYCLFLSPSKGVSMNLSTAYPKSKNIIQILGYPRNDVFLNKKLVIENYYSKLNLKKYKKIVLYCPTYRENLSSLKPFTETFLEKLNTYFGENNYLFLIKKHPQDKDYNTINFPNIKDISNEIDDIQEILIFTDILITDYSSVLFDFVLTDRPVLFYLYDYEFYLKNCRDMYYDFYAEMLGPFANTENELFDLILNVDNWFNKVGYKKRYSDFKNKFNYYQDGKSCERVSQFLMKMMQSRPRRRQR